MKDEVLKSAQELVALLKSKNLKIATAESCTGGMVSAYLTAVPGASQIIEMGLTTYSNRIKNEVLGVDSNTLETEGAVSCETATQMAQNIRKLSGADIGVSVTGVAGPDGQDGYSAGNVFVAISYRDCTNATLLTIDPRDRNYVREQAVLQLFNKVTELIK